MTTRNLSPLRYDDAAEVGDRIRGYDFIEQDLFVEGVVTAKGPDSYEIKCTRDGKAEKYPDCPYLRTRKRVGKTLHIPFHLAQDTFGVGRFTERVIVLEENDSGN